MSGGHAFISYVRDDIDEVDRMEAAFRASGIPIWRDTAELWPGDDWRSKIKQAIAEDALVVIACFSNKGAARTASYQNEELNLAIEQMRLRRPNVPWLIPVRFDECDIPDLAIGGGRTLRSIHWANLFGVHYAKDITRLVEAVRRLFSERPSMAEDATAKTASALESARDGIPILIESDGPRLVYHHGSHEDLLSSQDPALHQKPQDPKRHQDPLPVPHHHHHHGSHQNLLSPAGVALAGTRVEAIVIPTTRHPAYLGEAAHLAHALDSTLVTLHSGQLSNAETATTFLSKEFSDDLDLIAINVPGNLRMPQWETWRIVAAYGFARASNLATKRNLGLIIGHMLGWSRILFLSDSLTGLSPADVREASGLLVSNNAVGLQVDGFPDHSVVSHAYRQLGGMQRSFVSGDALAVDLNRCNSFFPDAFNDDWFFLLDGDHRLQPTAVTGRVYQYPYDPFSDSDQARDEELGDVLAEGVFWLLDQGLSLAQADLGHWERFLMSRRLFIDDIIAMMQAAGLAPYERDRQIKALENSLGRLSRITPQICLRYLEAWRKDLLGWRRFIASLPVGVPRSSILTALADAEFPGLSGPDPTGKLAGSA